MWEKRASNAGVAEALTSSTSLDSDQLSRRKTLDVVNKFEAMASSEKKNAQELAKLSTAYRASPTDGNDANKENEPRGQKSLREIAKETAMNRSNERVEKTTEKMLLRQNIADIKKSLRDALAALDEVSARVDKM